MNVYIFTAYNPESNLNLRIHKIRINNSKGKSHIFQFSVKELLGQTGKKDKRNIKNINKI